MPCSVALRRRNVGLQEYRHAAEGVHGDAKAAEQGLHRYGALLSQLPPTVSICSRCIRALKMASDVDEHLPLRLHAGDVQLAMTARIQASNDLSPEM